MEGDKVFSWDSLKGSMDVAHGKKKLDLDGFLS